MLKWCACLFATALCASSICSALGEEGLYQKPEIPSSGPNEDRSAGSRNDRLRYRALLDKTFLEAGKSMGVFTVEPGDKDPSTASFKKPTLVFFGYWSRVNVYHAVKALNVLAEAKKLGFKQVTFYDKGGNGAWHYDISKSASACAKDLCL